jgi:uncharacterized DUF497 family protein
MYNVNICRTGGVLCVKVTFDWDEKKNLENKRKHGVSFEEASTIFLNFSLEVFFDPDNSTDEDRCIAVGYTHKNNCLLVVHCENFQGSLIRIISARKATRKEQKSALGVKK